VVWAIIKGAVKNKAAVAKAKRSQIDLLRIFGLSGSKLIARMGHFFKSVILHSWYWSKSHLPGFRRRLVIPKILVNKQALHLKLE
jgi:hypothetical protein